MKYDYDQKFLEKRRVMFSSIKTLNIFNHF